MTENTLPNGVASGDVTASTAVLWSRSLALGDVVFTVATDPNFMGIVATETVLVADPQVPVKVYLDSLSPKTQYFYRVTNSAGETETGQFRTPALANSYEGLRFGVSGDWQGELSPYPAIANVPDRNLDFFVQMGDTLEADSESAALPGVTQAQTLDEFRIKHAEIYTERFGANNWADLRASTAVYATWDDHDVTNDFAGGAAPADSPQKANIFGDATTGFVNDTPAFDDALQAFQEYKPLRDEFYGDTGDERTANEQNLYRYNTFGLDAATYVLDVRSFRDAPLPFISEAAPAENIEAYLESAFEPGRTMLGAAQLEQFKQDLLAAEEAGITWKFVMSTVPMQNFGVPVAGERWEGYAAERAELLSFIEENDINNVVFVTGDFHGNVVNNVTYQEFFGGPQIQTDVIDVMIGPVGIQLTVPFLPAPFNQTFAAPFGPATVGFTPASLLAAQGKSQAEYLALTDVAEKDQFVREVLDARLTPLGYDPVGLEGSGIAAKLLQGEYIAAHNYGWSEFEINPLTQVLTVTTYGVTPYTEAELLADPASVLELTPKIVSQFQVTPTLAGTPVVWRNANRGLTNIWFTEGGNKLGGGPVGDTVSSPNWTTVGVGDFDNDGERGDILWRNTADGRNVVWLMDGANKDGSTSLDTIANTDWQIQGVGDFDHLGYADDILWRNQITGKTIVWTMDGTTRTGNIDFGTVGTAWLAQGVGDFEANSNIDDIVWRNYQTGQTLVWITDGTQKTDSFTFSDTVPTSWEIEGVNDLDGDGVVDDLLWFNESNYKAVNWFIDNRQKVGNAIVASAGAGWDAVI